MSYTWKGEQHFESTKSRTKALAKKILNKREGEIAMQLFEVGQQGERMSFRELCQECESAHVPTLAANTQTSVRGFLENMRKFFGDRSLADIDAKSVTEYGNHRKAQPSRKNPTRAKRMLNLEEEQRILENAPPYLRAAIGLLAQTGGRTYTEGFSLRWDQIDLDHNVIFFRGKTKTEGSSEPVPLTGLAHDVLLRWKKEQGGRSPFLFPSPVKPDQPITTVKTA